MREGLTLEAAADGERSCSTRSAATGALAAHTLGLAGDLCSAIYFWAGLSSQGSYDTCQHHDCGRNSPFCSSCADGGAWGPLPQHRCPERIKRLHVRHFPGQHLVMHSCLSGLYGGLLRRWWIGGCYQGLECQHEDECTSALAGTSQMQGQTRHQLPCRGSRIAQGQAHAAIVHYPSDDLKSPGGPSHHAEGNKRPGQQRLLMTCHHSIGGNGQGGLDCQMRLPLALTQARFT